MLPGNERDDLEHGGKIIMPPSALDQLSRLNVQYPMLFKLTNPATSRTTHCGVLEFIADEGKDLIRLAELAQKLHSFCFIRNAYKKRFS